MKSKIFSIPVLLLILIFSGFLFCGCGELNDEINDIEIFTVEFNSNYPVGVNSNYSELEKNVVSGSKIILPIPQAETYTKYDTQFTYIFVSWYKNKECTKLWIEDYDIVDANITLYAKWKNDIKAEQEKEQEINDYYDWLLYEINQTYVPELDSLDAQITQLQNSPRFTSDLSQFIYQMNSYDQQLSQINYYEDRRTEELGQRALSDHEWYNNGGYASALQELSEECEEDRQAIRDEQNYLQTRWDNQQAYIAKINEFNELYNEYSEYYDIVEYQRQVALS